MQRHLRRRPLVALTLSCLLGVGSVALAIGDGPSASAAGVSAGTLTIKDNTATVITHGGSATQFSLQPPTGAACSGDTATGGYKWSTYMVPASVNPSTLVFDGGGPTPQGVGASFSEPLFSLGSPVVNKNTAVTTGLLTPLPLFDFSVYSSGNIPAGTYNLGYACIKGAAGPSQLDKYWNVQLTFVADGGDPIGVAWNATPIVTAPGIPGTPAVTPKNASVALSWTAPLTTGGSAITGYSVQKSQAGGAWTSVATGVHSPYTATGLVNGVSYRFRVAAINASFTGSYSAASASVVPRTVPTVPRSLVAYPYNHSVLLTWAAPASNGGAPVLVYRVQRSTNGVTWVTLTSAASAAGRAYLATGLVDGTSYKFRVAAINVAGAGPFTAAVASVPKPVPSAPGKPVATPTSTKVKLTWAAPTSAGGSKITAYRVQRSLDGITWTTVTSSAPLTRTFTVTGLVNGKAYRFRVAAINSFGAGPWSAVTVATPH